VKRASLASTFPAVLIGAACAASFAQAGNGPHTRGPAGLESPFLIGGSVGRIAPIDIGGVGVTGLLVSGTATLNGSESLSYDYLHLLVRAPDGRWLHRQDIGSTGSILLADDLDGDGLQDAMTWNSSQGVVDFIRQIADGTMDFGGTIGSYDSGLVLADSLWLTQRQSDDYPRRLVLSLYRWRGAEAGFLPLWIDSIGVPQGTPVLASAVVGEKGIRFLIVKEQSPPPESCAYWAIPIGEEGIGAPARRFEIPYPMMLECPVRSGDRRELFLWPAADEDRLFDLAVAADSCRLTGDMIEGMPGWNEWGELDAVRMRDGSITLGIHRRDTSGSRVAFVRLNHRDPPRMLRHIRIDSNPVALLSPDGVNVEMLTNRYDTYMTRGDGSPIAPEPDVSIQVSQAVGATDLDDDGVADLLLVAYIPGGPALCYCPGLGHPPWFGPPARICAIDRAVGQVATGDLDGDGRIDLLLRPQALDSTEIIPVFWRPDGYRTGESIRFGGWLEGDLCVADFERNGRAEMIIRTYPDQGEVAAWNADGTLDPSVRYPDNLLGVPHGVADINGDGTKELLTTYSSGLLAWNPAPHLGIAEELTSFSFSGDPLLAVDLDGNGRDEIILCYRGAVTVLSYDGSGFSYRSFQRKRDSFVTCIAANDIDADGQPEVILSVSGQLSIETLEVFPGYQTPSRVWSAPPATSESIASGPWIQWCDLDRDGDADQVMLTSRGIRVVMNEAASLDDSQRSGIALRMMSENPGRAGARIGVRQPVAGSLRFELYDVAGRALWRETRDAPGGRWFEMLVTPQPTGDAIATGVYFLKVEGGGRRATRRILLGF
jgi:hypothetical protein